VLTAKKGTTTVTPSTLGLVLEASAANSPYTHRLVFSHASFTYETVAKSTTQSYTLTITIDDGLSTASATV